MSPHSPPWGLGRCGPLRPTRNHPPLNPVPFPLSSAIQIGPGLTSSTILVACVQYSPLRDGFSKHEWLYGFLERKNTLKDKCQPCNTVKGKPRPALPVPRSPPAPPPRPELLPPFPPGHPVPFPRLWQ